MGMKNDIAIRASNPESARAFCRALSLSYYGTETSCADDLASLLAGEEVIYESDDRAFSMGEAATNASAECSVPGLSVRLLAR